MKTVIFNEFLLKDLFSRNDSLLIQDFLTELH